MADTSPVRSRSNGSRALSLSTLSLSVPLSLSLSLPRSLPLPRSLSLPLSLSRSLALSLASTHLPTHCTPGTIDGLVLSLGLSYGYLVLFAFLSTLIQVCFSSTALLLSFSSLSLSVSLSLSLSLSLKCGALFVNEVSQWIIQKER
jgi:hypothetical protein